MMKPSGDAGAAHGNVTSRPPPAINVSLGRLLLLFVAGRLLYLVLIDPGDLLNYPGEEPYRGTIAQELVTGLTLPFTDYRADNYSGGSLVIGALAAGFFLLFGPTTFALKLAPLVMFTLALVFWYWTIERYAGERVAQYFALLFCFSPPLFTAYSVTAMGFHSESIVFSALTVLLLFRMLSEEKPSVAYPVILGLTAGFGLWFTYIYGLTLLAMLLFWVWHDKGVLPRMRVLLFAIGFLVGFSPWIVMNVQNHFAGLVVHEKNVWEHFGLAHLWDGVAHPRRLAPYEFFADIASVDDWGLYRRAVNLLYSLLYLGPILAAGVLRLRTFPSDQDGTRPARLTLVGFGILYLGVFALALQFSDFRADRFHLPAYPFLFFFAASSLARCQDMFPLVQRKIQTVFIASMVLLCLGTHTPLLSLDRPGYALSAKGYTYATLPENYWHTHAPAGSDDRKSILEVLQRPLLSDILPKLSTDDRRDLSLALVGLLAAEAPLSGGVGEFSRIERVVPPGFERYFYYQFGATAIGRYPKELPKAIADVEFLHHRSAAAHHLALVGIYRSWPWVAAMDSTPEALANSPARVAPELSLHYWAALGRLAGQYWYEKDQSLNQLNAHLQSFVPRLDPSVQQAFLQGIGELLFVRHSHENHWVAPAELEGFPQDYQEGLLEGWGMALGELELFSPLPWKGDDSPYWTAWTKGLSAKSLVSIQRGKAQFDVLFEGPAPSVLEPPRHAR